jgi:hypothetical protein
MIADNTELKCNGDSEKLHYRINPKTKKIQPITVFRSEDGTPWLQVYCWEAVVDSFTTGLSSLQLRESKESYLRLKRAMPYRISKICEEIYENPKAPFDWDTKQWDAHKDFSGFTFYIY